jgi:hypothetical protein
LKRVRAARVAIRETRAPGPPSPKRDARTSAPVADRARVQEGLRQLMLLDRYERRTISQRNRAVRSASLVRQDGGEGTV